jgi:hypothetical protein
MGPAKDKKPPSPWFYAFSPKVLEVGGAVGLLTILIVLVSVLGGIWLDKVLGTKPLFTVSLVLASAPVSLALTFYIATRSVKETRPSSPVEKSSLPVEREGDEEE